MNALLQFFPFLQMFGNKFVADGKQGNAAKKGPGRKHQKIGKTKNIKK